MAPSRRKGGRAAAAAAAAGKQWKIGDLVLAKMKGFPAWPAMVSEPEKWGFSSVRKKLLVYFYGTKQIAFCNYADIEAFTEEKKKSLLVKRQGKGADFVRAVDEIIDIYEKKQKLSELNSGDEGNKPHNGHFEGSRNKSSGKSPEINPDVNNNNKLEAIPASENHDAIDPDEIRRTSVEVDHNNTSTFNNEPTEKVSILDQLRQTPLSTTTATRKRQRDGSLQCSVIQRVPSLRRSRSSSGGDPCKSQKPSMTGNGADQVGSDLVLNILQENSTLGKKLSGNLTQVALCDDLLLPVSVALPLNCTEDILSEKTDAQDDSTLESDCKIEKSANGFLDRDLVLNEVAALNGKLDLPVKAAILKKKRKPNRKWSTNSLECATLDKETEIQSEWHESHTESPVSHNEIVENFIKADGDEHLPLVKRARVRMGKLPTEEAQLNEFVEKREKLDMLTSLEELDMDVKSSSPVSSCPAKETTGLSSVNDCTLAGRDPVIWNINTFQLKGIPLDVEAALPPSKRLHRALEAMSANAAEAIVDTSEAPRDVEIISDGGVDSQNTNPVNCSVEGTIGSPLRSQSTQSSDNSVHDNASGSSSLASRNPKVAMLTPSELEPVDSLTRSLWSPQKQDCKEILVGAKHCDGPCTSEMPDIDAQEKVLQSCSFKSVEGRMNATSNEGMSDQPSSPLEHQNEKGTENEKESMTMQSSKKCLSHVEGARESGTMKSVEQKPDYVLNFNEGSNVLSMDGSAVTQTVRNVASTSGISSGSKSSNSQSVETIQGGDMLDIAKEVKYKGTPKGWCTSNFNPMKDLIAAAQAKLLSRSTSFPDNVVDGKDFINSMVSPPAINRSDSSVQGSPQNSIYRRPASDDRTNILQNGSRSPVVGQREKGFNKLMFPVEANVARRSFEALLCTLSRTKDSIGRATRVAIDCAKYGIAAEVIETIVQHLERQASLHRRVDLFFLVDSITQFSRSQKGRAGDVYLSLVQSALPRMLSAAAPHGNTAWENRRQCLKVLRLWLERKTLPESIVRHHIRELESVNEASLPSSYSRRPSRTERALNDPIREMEGMFVDEYGSNTSFQLQNFIHPRLLEDEEGSSDDEKSFEAVTPEHSAGVEDEKGIFQTPNEKQCHILEDVDGELEMEDLAPPCGVEAGSSCHVSAVETVCDAPYQHEQRQSMSCAPPLPEDLPPSPPPLPASPPPLVPSCLAPPSLVPQQHLGGSHSNTDITEFHLSGAHNNQNQQAHSVSQQPNNCQGNFIASEPAPCTHGYGGFPKHIPPPPCSLGSSAPFSSHSAMHSGNNFEHNTNNFEHNTNPPLPNKAYHLQPPPPRVSNQFSYLQAEPQQITQSWSGSSFCDQFQYANGPQGGTFYGDGNIRGPIQHDNPERARFSPAVSTGSVLPDKVESLPGSFSPYGPYSEAASNRSHGWSVPPRISSYSGSASSLSREPPISQVNGAQGYWRPR